MYNKDNLIAGQYKVKKLLGAGAYGYVYLVEDTYLASRVIGDANLLALKLLKPEYNEDEKVKKRFIQEFQISRALSEYDFIIKTFYLGITPNNEHFFTMEYVAGESLRDYLNDNKKMPFKKAVTFLKSLAAALGHIHGTVDSEEKKSSVSKGFVHRDIKPENIMLTGENTFKITDFGTALSVDERRMTAVGTDALGSLDYISPEVLKGNDTDYKTDIYLFGLTAFEIIVGKTPRQSLTNEDKEEGGMFAIPDFVTGKSGIEPWIQDVVEKCCEENPSDRYQSMKDVLNALILGKNANSLFLRIIAAIRTRWYFIKETYRAYIISVILVFLVYVPLNHVYGKNQSGIVGETIENFHLDQLFKLRGETQIPDDIKIVYIDEASYGRFNTDVKKNNFPREQYANLLKKISALKPNKIILDILFLNEKDPAADKMLSDSLALSPTYIIKTYKNRYLKDENGNIYNSRIIMEPEKMFNDKAAGVFRGTQILRNEDGKVRKLMFAFDSINTPFYEIIHGTSNESANAPKRGDYINYFGSIKHISAVDIFDDKIKDSEFEGKNVIVGQNFLASDGTGDDDRYPTVFNPAMPGTEIHANALLNVIHNNWIRRFDSYSELIALLTLSLITTILIFILKPKHAVTFTVGSILLWSMSSYLLFVRNYFLPGAGLFMIFLPLVLLIKLILKNIAKK